MKNLILFIILSSNFCFAASYYESFLGYFKAGNCTTGEKISVTAKLVQIGSQNYINFSIANRIGQTKDIPVYLADTRISSNEYIKAQYSEFSIVNNYFRMTENGRPAQAIKAARSATANRVRIGQYDSSGKLVQECVFYRNSSSLQD